jgi:Rnl2 family RNA ligase
MKFQKYSSIENHYRTEFIERIRMEGMDGGKWIATEKIHGANFSIWVNATNTKIAKRSGLMPDATSFFNVSNIVHELKERARNMYRGLHPRPKVLVIYGELFGGCYPHPKVGQNPNYKKVQQGVWYSPDLQFAVYDIKINDKFVSWGFTYERCVIAGFMPVPEIHEGTFEECLNLRNDYSSVVHKEWLLPKIKGNIMEGIVIRPVDNRYLRRGERIMIKSKNRKFSETRDKKPRKVIKLCKVGKEMINKSMPMITGNRYDAVVSKIGDVTPKDFGRILGLIIQDIHDELINDTKFYLKYQNIDKAERKLCHRTLAPEVAVLIREKLLGIKPYGGKK